MVHRLVSVLASLAAVLALAAAPPAPKRPSAVERIPDPAYAAKRGDQAMLYGYDPDVGDAVAVLASVNALAYEDYWTSAGVGDLLGVGELVRRGDVVIVPQKTGVLVLEIEKHPAGDVRHDAAVVRVTDGPLRGAKLWVATYRVCRLVANPDYVAPPPEAEKPAAPGPAPAPSPRRKGKGVVQEPIEDVRARLKEYYDLPVERQRQIREGARKYDALTAWMVAENLRKSGKTEAARKEYERILREYSDLPEAPKARERLKALPK